MIAYFTGWSGCRKTVKCYNWTCKLSNDGRKIGLWASMPQSAVWSVYRPTTRKLKSPSTTFMVKPLQLKRSASTYGWHCPTPSHGTNMWRNWQQKETGPWVSLSVTLENDPFQSRQPFTLAPPPPTHTHTHTPCTASPRVCHVRVGPVHTIQYISICSGTSPKEGGQIDYSTRTPGCVTKMCKTIWDETPNRKGAWTGDSAWCTRLTIIVWMWKRTNTYRVVTIESVEIASSTKRQPPARPTGTPSSPLYIVLKMFLTVQLSRDMTKPTKWLCAQRRFRSAWESAQSEHSLRCPPLGP